MTDTMRSVGVLVLTVAAVVAGLAPRAAASGDDKCYLQSEDDLDLDGYAKVGAQPDAPLLDGKTVCPSGYVRMGGDCRDDVKSVHPRQAEIAFNGMDDDCSNGKDESEPVYSTGGNQNTATSFKLTIAVKSGAVMNLGSNVHGLVELDSLGATGGTTTLPRRQMSVVTRYPMLRYAYTTVGDLQANTVYRARVQFTTSRGSPVGQKTDWYYTATDGTSTLDKARTAIVLRGLKQYDDSERGLVGYLGTVDKNGSRYGAGTTAKWCSEFYSWTAGDRLENMTGRGTTDSIAYYFSLYGAWRSGTSYIPIGRRGDYLAMDTHSEGKKNHSALLLAVETESGGARFVHTLEGNWGNQVVIKRRPLTGASDVFMGTGRLESDMLE